MSASARRAGITCVCLGAVLVASGVALAVRRADPPSRPLPAPVRVADVGRVPGGTPLHPPAFGRPVQPERLPPGTRLLVHGVTAPVGTVRVADGELDIPRDPGRVGWWRGSAAPGTPAGTVVIAGHVNYAGVTGALAVLPELRPGERVVIAEPGDRIRYRVTGVRTYAKRIGLPAGIFTAGGRARLALVTCGGAFDARTGNYVDNVVAYAVPLR